MRTIEGLMEEDFMQVRVAPGQQSKMTSSRAWLGHRSKVQHFPNTIRWGWILAGFTIRSKRAIPCKPGLVSA